MSTDLFTSIRQMLINAGLWDSFISWLISQTTPESVFSYYTDDQMLIYLNSTRTLNDWLTLVIGAYGINAVLAAIKSTYANEIYSDATAKQHALGYTFMAVPVERLEEAKALIDSMMLT